MNTGLRSPGGNIVGTSLATLAQMVVGGLGATRQSTAAINLKL